MRGLAEQSCSVKKQHATSQSSTTSTVSEFEGWSSWNENYPANGSTCDTIRHGPKKSSTVDLELLEDKGVQHASEATIQRKIKARNFKTVALTAKSGEKDPPIWCPRRSITKKVAVMWTHESRHFEKSVIWIKEREMVCSGAACS